MSEFLKTATNIRSLKKELKNASLDEIDEIIAKLGIVKSYFEEKKAEEIEAEKERLEKIKALHEQMAEAGISIDDLKGGERKSRGANKPQQKRPIRYAIKDSDGNEVLWTGIGRAPRPFAEAFEAGKSKEDFLLDEPILVE